MKHLIVYDTECYKDYFLVMFRNIATGKTKHFELHSDSALDILSIKKILLANRIVGFNSINYDTPVLSYALTGADNAQLKKLSDYIIVGGYKYWQCETAFGFKIPHQIDQIDLIEVANGKGSLKAYGGKLHSKKLQDLPIDPSDSITPELREGLRSYCANDLQTTIDLYTKLKPQIELREQMSVAYGIDLKSKSDAQMAEHVIKKEVEKISSRAINKPKTDIPPFKFKTPAFIEFKTKQLQNVLKMIQDAMFVVIDSGKVMMPEEIGKTRIKIGNGSYAMGVGGLHSQESCVTYKAEKGMVLSDRDVVSYYPSIILKNKLYPDAMGKEFLNVYKSLVDRRVAAKLSGDKVTSDSLKVTINGSFGKFGSKYSSLYSPDLLIQTTITGQLSLLMLIEALEMDYISVVSANTDGIVIYCHENELPTVEDIIKNWENITGFETEDTRYSSIHSRDVNNFIAVKEKGGVKLKGAYAPPEPIGSSWPNPHTQICTEAVVAHLTKGDSIENTIRQCSDMRQFVTTRQVKGGAVKDDVYLGKTCRWYYATGVDGCITYKINGYTVPRSEGAMPCMMLSDAFPDDVNYAWYMAESHKILKEIGI